MTVSGYTTLTRQAGLMNEMRVIANNIANANTSGFRRTEVIFSEYMVELGQGEGLSMANGNVRRLDTRQGTLTPTSGTFDMAIEGEGYFMVQTPNGPRLTRSGVFATAADGTLVSVEGHPVLDESESPIFIPPDAQSIQISKDGTISADQAAVGKIGAWVPQDLSLLTPETGTLFSAPDYEPASEFRLYQGMIEESNVNPIAEISRMIEVQRAYELGQSFLENEDKRQKNTIEMLGS